MANTKNWPSIVFKEMWHSNPVKETLPETDWEQNFQRNRGTSQPARNVQQSEEGKPEIQNNLTIIIIIIIIISLFSKW